MPIRKRLTDPFSDDVKKFERHLREGKPPPLPRKPSAADREPFVYSLMTVPVDQILPKDKFFRRFVDKYMQERFTIWGQTLYIMPAYTHLDDLYVKCTGASVKRINRNRRGVCPMLRLKGLPRTWYSQVLHWIEETEYE